MITRKSKSRFLVASDACDRALTPNPPPSSLACVVCYRPPALPPHLRHIILNKPTPTIDPQSLPVPQYVSLNHLYCTAIKDGMMVLGATQRYRDKYFTVVFYSVMHPSGPQPQPQPQAQPF